MNVDGLIKHARFSGSIPVFMCVTVSSVSSHEAKPLTAQSELKWRTSDGYTF